MYLGQCTTPRSIFPLAVFMYRATFLTRLASGHACACKITSPQVTE